MTNGIRREKGKKPGKPRKRTHKTENIKNDLIFLGQLSLHPKRGKGTAITKKKWH
jgi:hypothetical protein